MSSQDLLTIRKRKLRFKIQTSATFFTGPDKIPGHHVHVMGSDMAQVFKLL